MFHPSHAGSNTLSVLAYPKLDGGFHQHTYRRETAAEDELAQGLGTVLFE